ncbi:hypothetical protein HF086_006504 [Spodoptera exigua]|uniref:Peptidase S1 domain-containing protein n=1 Tax=Spodoptera exigua TaxID=7107 RepID=A0A922MK54_SPOEX|nr:hypothetical protein HF086_006504 [Spodoptera exigua]
MLKSLVAFSLLTCNFGDQLTRIKKGKDAKDGEYPFVVVVLIANNKRQNGFIRRCTASMIAKDCALTAAHCATNATKNHYIWYGNYTVSPLVSNLYTPIIEVIMHSGFHYKTVPGNSEILSVSENDIALLRVNDITLIRYGSVSLLEYTVLGGLPVKFVGYGRTNKEGDDQLRQLQVGEGFISQCSHATKQMTNFAFCVSPQSTSSASTAIGDSGGPLLYDDQIVGILSFGDVKEDAYVPLSPYLNWIYSHFRLISDKNNISKKM